MTLVRFAPIADLQLDPAIAKKRTFRLVLGDLDGVASLFGFRAASTKSTARDHLEGHELPSKHDSQWQRGIHGFWHLGRCWRRLYRHRATHPDQTSDTCAHEVITS